MSIIGIIGGSGVYDLPGLRDVKERRVKTPFGDPSDAFRVGTLGASTAVFLARHGRGHTVLPGELNARANVWGFKALGCERLISFSAVGSLREDMAPGHVVLPDQAIDRTSGRASTFFGDGCVAHVGFAEPTCASLRSVLAAAARSAGAPMVHEGGALVCMEGPAFSTRAESHLHRSFGAAVVGMTMLPEAKLAREAELCYATVGLVTDWDCWRDAGEDVHVSSVLAVLHANAELARRTAADAVARLSEMPRSCGCGDALALTILTAPEAIPAATRRRLDLLIGRHVGPAPRAVQRRAAARRAGNKQSKTRRKNG